MVEKMRLSQVAYLEMKVETLENAFEYHKGGYPDPYLNRVKPDCRKCDDYQNQIAAAKTAVQTASNA